MGLQSYILVNAYGIAFIRVVTIWNKYHYILELKNLLKHMFLFGAIIYELGAFYKMSLLTVMTESNLYIVSLF